MRRTPSRSRSVAFLRILLLLLLSVPAAAADPAQLLALLREGRAVALIRHAHAPGVGDPAGMRLDDCATQRNLDETGRRDAAALGNRLREAGLREARLFTSQWCRARDTAALLGFGAPTDLPALDSFFGARHEAEPRLRDLRRFLADLPPGPPALLVTHQVNIAGLTGVSPATAETIFVDARPPHAVLGRIR
jgi:hypothetical protein